MRRPTFWLPVALAFFAALPAQAHRQAESYLYLQIRSDSVSGRFEIALSDLNHALGREGTAEEITPENFDQHVAFLHRYYGEKVSIYHQGRELPMEWSEHGLLLGHGTYAQLAFDLGGREEIPENLTFDYNVLFEEEPSHRGFLLVEYNWATGTFANESQISLVFRPDDRRKDFDLTTSGKMRGFLAVVQLGMEHIWEGIDHILFLVALLIPAVLRRENGQWQPVERFTPALIQVVKIVTAFTVAHSLTLSLAALGVVRPPGRLVEAVIAASIIIVAADLLVPIFEKRLWLVVIGFGLFHGFGFAGALSEMGVLGEYRWLSLLAFNLGVEIGQVVIVAVLVPVLFAVRRPKLYRRWAVPMAAVGLILIAGVWATERTFGVAVPMRELLPPALQKVIP